MNHDQQDRSGGGPAVRDEDAAVESLKRFGLSTYEAKVFIALQKLEVGSASDVAEVSDVPRSQVYGAAEELESRGLIDVKQGTPTQYRPIDIEAARTRLYEQLRSRGDAAFEYVDAIRGQHATDEERSEAIWTVSGAGSVDARSRTLIENAESRIVVATGEPTGLEPLLDALGDALDRGVDVTVVSAEEPVLAAAGGTLDGADTRFVPEDRNLDVRTGRVLLVDDDSLLMSVLPGSVMSQVTEETAFWTSQSGFAMLLVGIIREWIEHVAVR